MMTIAGNPVDYILIFGGTGVQHLEGIDLENSVEKIKDTYDDFWVFNVRNKLWQPIYTNSLENPGPTEFGSMITFSADRMILMYGG
jgi:hypothetical protein